MTADTLAILAGIILSLVFSYAPKGLNAKYAALEPNTKRLIMLGLLVLVSGASFGLACWTVTASWLPALTCTAEGLKGLIVILVQAIVANQATYLISPEPKAVTKAKSLR